MNPHRQNFPHLIFLLAFSGAVQLLQEYCENNVCDFLMEDDKGRNILHYAALSNQPECLNWLLTKNIPISSNNKYCWLLNTASIGGNLSMIKKAADLQQTNLDACDSQNRNAIYLATLSGNFEAVDHLLSLKKISPRLISFITKMNCLHIAAGKGDEKLFMLLAGTNQFRLSDIDCFNRNVLHHAYKGKCKTIINFVESHSKSLQMVRDSFGWIPQRYLTGVPDKKLAKKNPGDPVRQQNLQRKYFDSEDRAAGQEFAKR